jgi:hypothetical protein
VSGEKQAGVEIRKCCGREPDVWEMYPGDWVAYCKVCLDGTLPHDTREEAIAAWNANE